MIKQKELINRVNVNNACLGFDYMLKLEDITLRCIFEREEDKLNTWKFFTLFERTDDTDGQIYNFSYTMPKCNMDLTMVAAIGLRYFQLRLKEEVQIKSNIDFGIGETIKGIVG